MAQFYHRDCGGAIAAGFQITMRILSFSISDRTLTPGAAEARIGTDRATVTDGQVCDIVFYCTICGKEFKTKSDLEAIEGSCAACGKKHPVKEMVSTSYTSIMGETCLDELLSRIEDPIVPKGCRRTSVLNILSNKQIAI